MSTDVYQRYRNYYGGYNYAQQIRDTMPHIRVLNGEAESEKGAQVCAFRDSFGVPVYKFGNGKVTGPASRAVATFCVNPQNILDVPMALAPWISNITFMRDGPFFLGAFYETVAGIVHGDADNPSRLVRCVEQYVGKRGGRDAFKVVADFSVSVDTDKSAARMLRTLVGSTLTARFLTPRGARGRGEFPPFYSCYFIGLTVDEAFPPSSSGRLVTCMKCFKRSLTATGKLVTNECDNCGTMYSIELHS